MRRQSFSVLFFANKAKLLKNGEAPIVLRISVGGIRAESQIRRSVPPELWNQKKEMSTGRDRRAAELNEYICTLRLKALTIHQELELIGAHFTARIIMNKLYKTEERRSWKWGNFLRRTTFAAI